MPSAARLQFDRLIAEYQRWMSVAEADRSPAPSWWWSSAIALRGMPGELRGDFAQRLGLPDGASHAQAAQLFLDALAGQSALSWPEEFPRRYRATYPDEVPTEAV